MNLDLMRVTVIGNKGSRGRLLAIAAGVAIGVAILLVLWGASSGLRARDERTSWTNTWNAPAVEEGSGVLTEDSILALDSYDYYEGERIAKIDVATLPNTTVPFPGGITPPGPGEYYASPALIDMIDDAPAGELGDRYGTRVGTLPDDTLNGPDSLVVVVGHDPVIAETSGRLSLISEFDPSGRGENASYQAIMIIGGIAVFFPVVLFISVVTQLGAAQRQESFSTLRLIGASPKAVVAIASGEMALTSLAGAIAGVGLAWVIRPLAAMVPFNGETSYVSDFAVSPDVTLIVVISMVVVSTVAAGWRIKRAGIGPLGGSRQMREERPSWRRALPLIAGLVAMVLPTMFLNSGSMSVMVGNILFLGGFLLISLGIVLIGPWLTWQLSRLTARFARSAESVIASSRILATPAATFRSVGGLVVAVFMVSVFAGSASVVTEPGSTRIEPGRMSPDTLMVEYGEAVDSDSAHAALAEIDGVTSVIQARAMDETSALSGLVAVTPDEARALGFDEIPNASWVAFDAYYFSRTETSSEAVLNPADPDEIAQPQLLFVGTDGSREAIESVRTEVIRQDPLSSVAMTRADYSDISTTRLVNSLAVLAYLGIFFSVTIAGISLAVATVAAMLDRKRVLGLMRLMGMPAASIRRIIGLEAAVPLLAVLGGSIALGFFVAWMIVSLIGGGDYEMSWPDPLYFGTIAVSLLFAGLSIWAGSATVNRNTAVSATRFE